MANPTTNGDLVAVPEPTGLASLKPKWRERFDFFETYGGPGSAEYRAGYRALPFGKKMLISSNVIAFFFGPIYFFVIGLWKKGLTFLGIWLVLVVAMVAFETTSGGVVPDIVPRSVGFGMAALYMLVANYAYYLHKAKGVQSWNPFEGLVRKR
jgi:hypothetical protein